MTMEEYRTYCFLELACTIANLVLKDEIVTWTSRALQALVRLEEEIEVLAGSDRALVDNKTGLEVEVSVDVIARNSIRCGREPSMNALGTDHERDLRLVIRLSGLSTNNVAAIANLAEFMSFDHSELTVAYTVSVEQNLARQLFIVLIPPGSQALCDHFVKLINFL